MKMKKTLVIGLGSILRGDDGLGTRVIEELKKEKFAENVSLRCADTSGLDILKYFPDFTRVIIIDLAQMQARPGTIKVFSSREIKKSKFSDVLTTHGMALLETLTLAEKLGIPSRITIIGVQPKDVSFRLGLSDILEKKVPSVINRVRGLLKQKN